MFWRVTCPQKGYQQPFKSSQEVYNIRNMHDFGLTHTNFEFEFDPTLEHHSSDIFSSILKKQVRFEQLFELSTRICNRNFAILSRLGVTSIAVKDVSFDEKMVLFFIHTPSCVKNRVCIKNSKFKKLRTYNSHRIEYGQTYVFKNANF